MKINNIKAFIISMVVVAVVVMTAIYITPLVHERTQNVSTGKGWANLLEKHPTFSAKQRDYPVNVNFQYADPTDDNLKRLREKFDLDSVAGKGSETDRIINLTRWVYQLTGHANNPEFPKELNAFTLIHLATVEDKTINCYMKTIILNEVFLAMGFCSRQTHLLPHSNEEDESHFITSVYSHTLGKWIFMDPDFGIYITDEKDIILGAAEIRKRLIAGEPLIVKNLTGDDNVFVKTWWDITNWIEGTNYTWYLSKNIFKNQCPQISMFDQRSIPNQVYFELIPDGYQEELLQKSRITKRGNKIIFINDLAETNRT
jgi:hypothetical protein